MIDLIISATVGAIAGSAIMRRIDLREIVSHNRTHQRCADALATKQARIDRALACETPKAAHRVKKMARILRGEQG